MAPPPSGIRSWSCSAVARWGDRIAVALDARDGRLATDGWLGQTDTRAVEVAQRLAESGVRHFVYTDIRRDGTLAGPNLQSLGELIEQVDADVIASGGIASLEDIKAVATAGASRRDHRPGVVRRPHRPR